MKKLLLLSFILLASIAVDARQNSTTRFFTACNYENLTVDDTAGGVAFTNSKIISSACNSGAASVTFTIECSGGETSCPIRMTLDGTAPTTSVGMRADYQQSITIYSITNIKAFRAIREGATSAILNVQYFK